ncbi:FKBP-type peptidyl-prolyl cis-trans isomerase [Aggregicoccus sp. 17bor-14]|uniref:FKBP-type peptidyl-prolyl cis-trans isomerase n=1 Tax=Myxococcaceae TaxID=31 RepID=UPI00129C8BB5|nr:MULTISPECIES: FKBP-type peptidyl-prolyl cis-trans isomerase [Myxococcaceae]MBF5043821.1 FKBP-type peptidyl-prolyl cis-trans isomerase [Simulacricoccus sp. 17bor-14]MRI89573.1 FKBP-type peptidyl-prolyl cis-trans isomerase [Aggregicoccus sp. 17bor-14]
MRTMLLALVTSSVLMSTAHAQGTAKPAASAQPKTEDEKAFYALGFRFGESLAVLQLSPSELEVLKRGLGDARAGAPAAVDLAQYEPKLQDIARGRQGKANEATLARAAQEKGAQKLPSGVVYRELQAGSGRAPAASDTVKVNYRGTLITGEEFDSSYKRGEPAEFPLNGVISCWTEGLQRMKVGGKAKLTCPASKAYGSQPPPGSRIPPDAVLQFDVELVGISGK